MPRRAVEPAGLIDATKLGYSHAVETEEGRLVCSGQVGWDADWEPAEGAGAQARQAFENVETLLDAADRSLDDVTKVTAHVVDVHEHRDAVFEAFNEAFPADPYPCLTVLGVAALAREDLLVEIEVEL